MRMARHTMLVLAAMLAAAPAAELRGQTTELKLDENGEWLATRRPVEGSEEWMIGQARADLADDRPSAAFAVIDGWIQARERELGEPSPHMPEALLIRADARTAMGDEYTALYDYERVIREYPGTEAYVTAVERELDIGVRYVGGMRRKFFGVRVLDATDIGEELLIRVQERLPGSRLAERAGIELADFYYKNHELALSAEAYDLFLQNYRNSQYSMQAMQRRVYSTIAQFKGPKYDGSKLLDAQILVRRFASLYPTQARQVGLDDALLARLDESAGLSLLESARWYLRRNDAPAARYTLQRLIEAHPQTAAAREALEIMESRNWPMRVPKRRLVDDAGAAGGETGGTPAEEAAPAGAAAEEGSK